MAQQLRTLAILPEDLDLVPSSNMLVNNHFEAPVPEDPILSSGLLRYQVHTLYTNIKTGIAHT